MLIAVFALPVALCAALALQSVQQAIVRDSSVLDSAQKTTTRHAATRLPVTAAVLASAFHDARARDLFTRARTARMTQDSSIANYDARVRQRMTVRAGIGKFGPERLAYRSESSARVQWQRNVGAIIDVTGARVVIPLLGSARIDSSALQDFVASNEATPIPWFPGTETLWVGGRVAQTEANDRDLVNPLAAGAEAYYTYQTGDSVSFRFPDGHVIQLRELAVRPRKPAANVVVGSLWFDTATGQLVRAAYRLAGSLGANVSASDSLSTAEKAISRVMSTMLSSSSAEISSIAIEYGLFEGRFWLPRLQSMEGIGKLLFARVPVTFQDVFTYSSVNAPLSLTAIVADTTHRELRFELGRPPIGIDSAGLRKWRDSTRAAYVAALKAREDSSRAGRRVGTMRQCDSASTRIVTARRTQANIPVEVHIPCNTDSLTHSRDLSASVYDDNEAVFGSVDRKALIKQSLSMGAQAPFAFGMLPRPHFELDPSMTRYNRVEGFSTGLTVEQQLGAGYSARLVGRYGFSDGKPNAEFSIARTNMNHTLRLNSYTRLVAANDWGNPLTFGTSLSHFFFGRDEGFYYRAIGNELTWSNSHAPSIDLRAFSERQQNAPQSATFSVGGNFIPNISATGNTSTGVAARLLHNYGLDPRGFRVFTDVRLEGALGAFDYSRGAIDLTLSRQLVGAFDATLTLSGGSTTGQVSKQRQWFIGGTHTVRGQSADTAQSGNAYWLSRLEFAGGARAIRATVFGDIGWVGDRANLTRHAGRPLSGVGVGAAAFDGLLRVEVARGLYPRKQTRLDLHFNLRY